MKCRHFLNQHCLSCDLLSQEYLSSLAYKEKNLVSLFPDAADLIKPSVGMNHGVAGSRNKAKLAVAHQPEGLTFGFYDGAQHFKWLEDCPLHAPAINAILPILKPLIAEYKITPYALSTRKGELKFVIITHSESTHQLMIRFILRSSESIERLKKLTRHLISLAPTVAVVTANIQPEHQAILEGPEETVLTESNALTHHFGDTTLYQGSRSFFQTNTTMAHQLYQQFQTELAKYPVNSLLDLYCGVGAFSFFARRSVPHIVGVEISDAAIGYANRAKITNKAEFIQFIASDAGVYLTREIKHKVDAVVVNPPRRGLNASIITQLLALKPSVIFYSSCNAETLQRDIAQFSTSYQIASLQIFDMFPYTSHYETLAVLTSTQT